MRTHPPTHTLADRGAAQCSITSPQCVLITANKVIFCNKSGVFLCSHSDSGTIQHEHYFSLIDTNLPLVVRMNEPRITFIDISPCEQYLFVGIKIYGLIPKMWIVVADLEGKAVVLKEQYPLHFNCALWMPPSGAYGMGICVGIVAGNIAMYSNYKLLQHRK
jgi:hypothetical protein